MGSISDFKARMQRGGADINESSVNHVKKIISETFADSPSYQEVYINTSATPTGVWIVDNSEIKDTQVILSQYTNPINAGDIVEWNSKKWLIIIKDDMTDVYHKGTISKCISSLKWKNSSNVEKEAFFTYKSDSSGNFGIDEGRIINLGNERRNIIIQSNNDTKLIDKNYRFIMDDRAWKVIAKDGLVSGLIYLTLEEDTTTNADDTSTRIADNATNGGGFW